MILFKEQIDLFSLVILMGFAFILNLLVGWFMWIKTQDVFSTILAVSLVILSFLFNPAVKKRME